MKSALKLSTFQFETPVKRGQGLRIGVTRRPPRGIRKARYKRDGYFDVWLPAIAPSSKLLSLLKGSADDDPKVLKRFFDSYERELLATAEGRQTIKCIAQIAALTHISIGCFCEDESRCHRSSLYRIIHRYAPRLSAPRTKRR
jgi:uncharacterized protein YeaO (DUF488 family)